MKGIHEIISKFCVMVNMKKEDCWYIGIIKKSTKQDCPFFLDEKKRDISLRTLVFTLSRAALFHVRLDDSMCQFSLNNRNR